jgi:heat shock protein HslJ
MRLFPLLCPALVMYALAVPVAAHEQHVEGTEWGVVGDAGADARYISFAGSGRVFGFGGCNHLSGNFEQHDGHLTISALAATGKACAAASMTKEREFLELLSKVRGVKVDHTLLLFLDEAGADLKALTRRNAGTSESTTE